MRKNLIPIVLFSCSILFFVLGLLHPIMGSDTIFGIKREEIYILSSITFFYDSGDYFIGSILLVFTFIFPCLKYLFLGTQLAGFQLPNRKGLVIALELINKWAMLDVFIVALVILNLKFDSLFIKTSLKVGTIYFSLSVLLLMTTSFIIRKRIEART